MADSRASRSIQIADPSTGTQQAGVDVSGYLTVIDTDGNALLTTIDADTSTLAAVDYATQTTLNSVDTKMTACDTGAVVIASGTITTVSTVTNVTTLGTITNAVTVEHSTGSIGHGVKTVTTAGTDVVLAGSTACKWVIVQSQTDNTGWIAVGATGIDATVATGSGVLLSAGQSVTLLIDNLADVFIDSTVDGEGVRYTYGAA